MNRLCTSWVLLFVWAALSVGCGTYRSHQPVVPRDVQLQRDARYLSSPELEGRGPGTLGLEIARDYLRQRLTEIGLDPVFASGDGGRSYLQPFEITLSVEAVRAALTETSTDSVATPDEDFTVLGFSADGAFDAEAVWVGYAIDAPELGYTSFTGMGEDGLAGKVAVALRFEPMDEDQQSVLRQRQKDRGLPEAMEAGRFTGHASLIEKARHVAARGAVGLIIINPPTLGGRGLKSTAASAWDRDAAVPVMHARRLWLQRVLDQSGRDGRQWVDVMTDRADRGVDRPERLRLSFAGQAEVQVEQARVSNVAGLLPGRGALKDQWVVVGAHYDHLGYGGAGSFVDEHVIHPGADDNASGVASALRAAERLASDDDLVPQDDPGLRPRRSLLVTFFTAEERGLLGATHLLDHIDELGIAKDQITAMVNLDMVGRLDDQLTVFGTGSAEQWPDVLRAARGGLNLPLDFNDTATGNSDHAVFHWNGIPAVHLFTGAHEDYHRPRDTFDKLNLRGLEAVTRFTADLLNELRYRDERLAFIQQDPHRGSSSPGAIGHGAYLGILPDYQTLDGERGAGVKQVLPGSPAEDAGLEPGDLIVRWGGEPVGNVRGLTRVLGESKPDQTVELRVVRGDDKITLPVTLGSR